MKTDAEIIKEIMQKYNEYRDKYIKVFGCDIGFDEWFNTQIGVKNDEAQKV